MKRIVSLFIYFSICVLSAQITFNTLPSDKQLVARDLQTNLGIVAINGEVNLGDNYNLEYDSWGTRMNLITLRLKKMLQKLLILQENGMTQTHLRQVLLC